MHPHHTKLNPVRVFHSDRGSQYTSGEYGTLCAGYQITQSVGRTGVCWDNAPSESFFATLKKELVNRRTFRTRAEARIAIRHWIESWYNRRRLSSVIGYQTRHQSNGRTTTVTPPTPWPHNNRVRPAGGTPHGSLLDAKPDTTNANTRHPLGSPFAGNHGDQAGFSPGTLGRTRTSTTRSREPSRTTHQATPVDA